MRLAPKPETGYPWMLGSRATSGFLGINSAALREAAVQRSIPDEMHAKLNALFDMLISVAMAVFSLLTDILDEILDLSPVPYPVRCRVLPCMLGHHLGAAYACA